MPNDVATQLQAHPLFARCTTVQQARLLAATSACTFDAGERLFEAGAQAEHYYWITHGTAKLSSTRSRTVGATQGLGLEAFAEGPAEQTRYLASAHALTPVSALRVKRGTLRELFASNRSLKSRALMQLATALGELPPAATAPRRRDATRPAAAPQGADRLDRHHAPVPARLVAGAGARPDPAGGGLPRPVHDDGIDVAVHAGR